LVFIAAITALAALAALLLAALQIQTAIRVRQVSIMPMAGHLQMVERVAQAQIVPQQVPEERPVAAAVRLIFSLAAALPSPSRAAVAAAERMSLGAILPVAGLLPDQQLHWL